MKPASKREYQRGMRIMRSIGRPDLALEQELLLLFFYGKNKNRKPPVKPSAAHNSIYLDVLEMGIKHDNHCSDLYLADCSLTHELFKKHDIKPYTVSASRFISAIDGRYWWELPFQYEPYWNKRQT